MFGFGKSKIFQALGHLEPEASLPDCPRAAPGELCEGDGQCGTRITRVRVPALNSNEKVRRCFRKMAPKEQQVVQVNFLQHITVGIFLRPSVALRVLARGGHLWQD